MIIKGKEIINPGQSKVIADIQGKFAIRSIRFFESYKDSVSESKAMRLLSIQATWDDDKKPAIWSPLGDFFGSGFAYRQYVTPYLGMSSGGYTCFFPMPFEDLARIYWVRRNSPKSSDWLALLKQSLREKRPVSFHYVGGWAQITHVELAQP